MAGEPSNFTATITYGDVSDTRTFEVTVLQKEPDYRIVMLKLTLKCKPGGPIDLPSIVIIKRRWNVWVSSYMERYRAAII